MADEVARLYRKYMTGELTFNAAIRQAKEMYKNSYQHTDQSSVSNHTQLVNDIIPCGTDIDNGEVFDTVTGNTIRDL